MVLFHLERSRYLKGPKKNLQSLNVANITIGGKVGKVGKMGKVVGLQMILMVTMMTAEEMVETEPSLRHSLTTPVVKKEGDDALMTCVVSNQGNYTLMWKKTGKGNLENWKAKNKFGSKVLTANKQRITSDSRMKVLHEEGGNVYVLLINNITVKDAGMYVCELNTESPVRSFHQLRILSDKLQPPTIEHQYASTESSLSSTISSSSQGAGYSTKDSLDVWGFSTENPITHDFSDCCRGANISKPCQGFCSLKNILDGNAGASPTDCEEEFPAIVSCMADGRNHLPCCRDAGVPDVCTDICVGEYNKQTDNIKSMFSCAAYTAPTLACIAVGINTLPKKPEDFSVTSLDSTSVLVSWAPHARNDHLTTGYRVNVTYLQFFSSVFSVKVDVEKAKEIYPPHSVVHIVDQDKSEVIISNLENFSLYEISMWAVNSNEGASLPTYAVKVVTHLEGEENKSVGKEPEVPNLPDVRACCIANNVSHAMCVNKFCDPRAMSSVGMTDLMICAPWDTEMFRCLADGKDHSPCCAAKQIPSLCQELCTGNVTDVNFRYFRCLSYMNEMSSCMLEGYGVLPSSPVNFRFSNLHTDFGILHWDRPEKLTDSVIDYVVNYRKINPKFGPQQSVKHAKSPFILEGLEGASTYEVFVEPRNRHGLGEASTRIVFRTASRKIEDLLDSEHPYNQTDCCVKSGIKSDCLPLCSYDASIAEVGTLSKLCADDFSKVVRCGAGGRDHLPCCTRRGVPASCQPLCQAVHQASTGADFLKCLPYIGQVVSCWEEGTLEIPAPVSDFRAVSVQDGVVVLAWGQKKSNSTDNVETTNFEVFYKEIADNSTGATVFDSDKTQNTTVPIIKISDLNVGKKYQFFAVSRNSKGTSLPSSIITLNASAESWSTKKAIRGAPSPPHLLAVESHSATWLQFTWNPPAISHPEDVLKYRLFYKQVSANLSSFSMVETDVTTVTLSDLIPNRQYATYTTTVISLNDSQIQSTPSETLIAWTDPAFPAFVEAPTIHPINMVTEGGNMTVLCIAMGTPLPTVTLYINNHPLRSQVTRHMVTMIHNVTSEMGHVSCYADNGYGTPMQVSRKITISRAPTMTIAHRTTSTSQKTKSSSIPKFAETVTIIRGDTLYVQCKIDAFPAPTMSVYRDEAMKQSIESKGRFTISAQGDEEDLATFYLTLKVINFTETDGSEFYCKANNTLGQKSIGINVKVVDKPSKVIDVRSCCVAHNVSSECLSVCTFSLLDLDLLALRMPTCLKELSKMMSCASDGSDHRHCCSQGGVPGTCLNWCRGEEVEETAETKVCAIEHSTTILDCFHKGRLYLPSPPQNVMVRPVNKSSAMVFWDLPKKNPHSVELYRVFWRPLGTKDTTKNDTIQRQILLTGLSSGTTYELVVKAGNANGTSQLTAPLKFLTADEFIIATSPVQSNAGGAVGIVMAVILVIAMVVVVVYVMKKKNLIVLSVKKPDSPSVAFENPFYTVRDPVNSQQIGSAEDYNVHISSSGSWHSEMSETGSGSRTSSNPSNSGQSSPQTPEKKLSNTSSPTFENPDESEKSSSSNILDKLNLNRDNGFKRFK